MAVNTAALKTFAPAMRRQLMEAVGRKLDLLLNSQTPDTLSTYAKQIAELRDEQEKSREQLLERVAYTWFNRLCALRYLDAKGWHPFGSKVLMPADGSETQPELLKLMRSGSLPSDLKTFTNEQRLNQLLDGQIPTAIPGGDAQGEVYRELVLAACRSYHQLLPDLFEGLDDASELLLPDDLLTEGSIAGSFRSSISDADCDDVEIIGWLYQFYISEKKDEVIGKVVKSEDIPAATQLFTPNWIVKYMVQNTIGAQWLATYPDSPLREQMEFYIEPAEQTDEVQAKLAEITPRSLNPEELTLMDPACGSGHILVEAYEVFKAIYLEQGYQLREIPKLIFEKNLFGLDIDQRAAQLSNFCLLMKGRADDRRLFDRGIRLNVMALQDSTDFNAMELASQINFSEYGLQLNDLTELKQLFEHATTFGSLIKVPEWLAEKLPALKKLSKVKSQELFLTDNCKLIGLLIRQATLLSGKYDTVAANPPYMGSKGMNTLVKKLAKDDFPKAKNDLFAMFLQRSFGFLKSTGFNAQVNMQSWMFLTAFQKIRCQLLDNYSIFNLVHIGYNSFPTLNSKIAQACACVFTNSYTPSYKSSFVGLNFASASADKGRLFLNRGKDICFSLDQRSFRNIPGAPIAFWITNSERESFSKFESNGSLCQTSNGIQTGNNDKYVRFWWEVNHKRIGRKWFYYNKGGSYRKWYGNILNVIDWQGDGESVRQEANSSISAEEFLFEPCLTWTDVTWRISGRYLPRGCLSDHAGPCGYFANESDMYHSLGILNTPLCDEWSNILNPTLHFQAGDFKKLPFPKKNNKPEALKIIKSLIASAKSDWDSSELSFDFKNFPAISPDYMNLARSFEALECENKIVIAETKNLESLNLSHVMKSFEIDDRHRPEILDEWVSLRVNPSYRFSGKLSEEEQWNRFRKGTMEELVSYASGCMMGRYSLDHPGLILADSRSNQDEQLAAYEAKLGKPISEIQFKPDADAIIPILDGEWFEDDIVARTREFLKVTFPDSSVAENLRFIEESIGKDIRKFFCKDFYKDHLQTYKKRPIYWMVQSPKAGFACLIYLHRYTPDTLLQVLNNYFRPYLQKLEARQEQLERDQNNDALPKREQTAARKEAEKITKVLKECQAWEQDALLPLAQQRIELDLDDGVKVNYLKLQEVLAKIPGLAAKGD